jgi:hypothetical protein
MGEPWASSLDGRWGMASRVPWRMVVGVLVGIVFLTGGWLLIGSWLDDHQRLDAGTVLRLGPTGSDHAQVRIPAAGWMLRKSASDPDQNLSLSRQGVDVQITYVPLPSRADAVKVWPGVRDLVRVDRGRLGAPGLVRTVDGVAGQQATLSAKGRHGVFTAYTAPGAKFAVEIKTLADDNATGADRAAAAQLTAEIRFTGEAS